MTIRAVVVCVLVTGMCGTTAAGTVYRCEVDGVTTFGQTTCADGARIAQAPQEAAGAAKELETRLEGCRGVARFARQVADGRRVGVARATVERATSATNQGLVGVVVRLYSVPLDEINKELAAIEQECRTSNDEGRQSER